MIYKTCPNCGANLDPGERCDCFESKYAALTPENRAIVDAAICELYMSQVQTQVGEQKDTAPSVDGTESGRAENVRVGR